MKFTQQRKYTSALEFLESLRPITLLKVGVGSPFLSEFPLMAMWNIWAFLTSTGPLSTFGLHISCLPVLVGEKEIPPPIRTGEVNLGGILEVLPSRGIVLSVSFRFTATWSWRARAPILAASVTITSESTVWPA